MATELADDVWQLTLRGVNAYLVTGEATTLVDAGTPWDADRIRTELASVDREVADVDRVLLTHYDLDHVGALAELTPELDAPLYLGAPDDEFLAGTSDPPVWNHKGALQRALGALVADPGLPIETPTDGEEIGAFTAHHTPGHTPGHVAYVSTEHDAAFLGDLVRESDRRLRPSGWATSYDTGDVERSIRRLDAAAAPFAVAGMGHGDPLREHGRRAVAALADALRD